MPAPSVDVGDDAAARRPEMAPIEALLPQIEELPEPEPDPRRRLDVDDPVGGMRVQEREAAAARHERTAGVAHDPARRADADAERDRARLAVDVDLEVSVHVVGELLARAARNAAPGCAGCRR